MKRNALYSAVAIAMGLVAGAANADITPYTLDDIKVTAGGFIEAAGIYRNRNEGADMASSWSAIPFNTSAANHLSETHFSARQSRLSLLVQGPERDGAKAEAYYEGDFLGAAPTANSKESNSYTPRVRHLYLDYTTNDGLQFLAGQNWSLLTQNTSGIALRKELVPMTIDAQYSPGFAWTRNSQFRLVKKFNDKISAGVSLENPQAVIAGSATGVVSTVPGSGNNSSGTNYSVDRLPDVIGKIALDPGYGHYEVISMLREFKDRVDQVGGVLVNPAAGHNDTRSAASFGANFLVPVFTKKVELQGSILTGRGVGRYGSSQLADVTFRTDGSLVALKGTSALLGIVAHPTSKIDLYAYAGLDKVSNTNNSIYGNGAVASNAGCVSNALAIPGACSPQLREAKQATIGGWYKFYQGNVGKMQAGLQFSRTSLSTYADATAAGTAPNTSMNVAMVSVRYYPFQK